MLPKNGWNSWQTGIKIKLLIQETTLIVTFSCTYVGWLYVTKIPCKAVTSATTKSQIISVTWFGHFSEIECIK